MPRVGEVGWHPIGADRTGDPPQESRGHVDTKDGFVRLRKAAGTELDDVNLDQVTVAWVATTESPSCPLEVHDVSFLSEHLHVELTYQSAPPAGGERRATCVATEEPVVFYFAVGRDVPYAGYRITEPLRVERLDDRTEVVTRRDEDWKLLRLFETDRGATETTTPTALIEGRISVHEETGCVSLISGDDSGPTIWLPGTIVTPEGWIATLNGQVARPEEDLVAEGGETPIPSPAAELCESDTGYIIGRITR